MLTKNDIERYFIAEKNEAFIFLIIGLLSVFIALLGFLIYRTEAWKGAAIPLVVIGIIQIVVGYSVYKRSDDDRLRMVYAYDMNPDEIKKAELPRMTVVNKNFGTYRLLEIGLAMAGLLIIFYNSFFALPEYKEVLGYSFSHGLGIALAIQAIIMLSTDFFAEKRAVKYTAQLKNFATAVKYVK